MNNTIIPKFFGQQLRSGHWSTDNLRTYWRGIKAGEAVDESLYRNHGTIMGATWVGASLDCAVNTDKVNFGTSRLNIDDTQSFTIILKGITVKTWVVANRIFGRSAFNRPVGFWLKNANTVEMTVQTTGDNAIVGAVNQSLPAGLTTTIAGTWDGATARIYINGIESNSISPAAPGTLVFVDDTREWHFGEGHQSAGSGFIGSGESILIYNRTLSASEIQQLYINPDLPMQQEPISLWTQLLVGVTVPVMIHHYKQAGGL